MSVSNPEKNQQPGGFKVKVYSKAELAALYFPDLNTQAARSAFWRFLSGDDKLYQELLENGYGRMRLLTPKLVQIIVDGLGAP